ncbi:MAG: hypothetical protein K2Q23_16890 [Bryobacteraceae bacterium]|nr:hypothetical protein [Bryobacteraceae bacterium]
MNPSKEQVQFYLEKLQNSRVLVRSERLRRFLAYTVSNTLAGETDRLKEQVIGVEVFNRPSDYDPKADSIVRVEAHRLRQKLEQYYLDEGSTDTIRFQLPKGAYLIQFEDVRSQSEPKAGRSPQVWKRVAGVAAIGMVGILALKWGGAVEGDRLLQPRRLSSTSGWATDPVLTPDGKSVIYSSDRAGQGRLGLWRRGIEGGEPILLTGGDTDDFDPDVSPDGKWIVFRSRRPGAPGIYRQDLAGGAPKLLAPAGSWPRISPDGKWVLYTVRNEQEWSLGTIFVVESKGGIARQLATTFADAHYGIWSEDGKHILFCGTLQSNMPEREHDWWVIPFPAGDPAIKTGALQHLTDTLNPGRRVPANQYVEQPGSWIGDAVYFSSPKGPAHSLWRVELGAGFQIDPSEPPQRLTQGTTVDVRPRVRRVGERLEAVFASGTYNIDVWALPADTNKGLVTGDPVRITSQPSMETFPYPDSKAAMLAYVGDSTGERGVMIRNLRTNEDRRLRASRFAQDHPVISPDGAWVAFRELQAPKVPIFLGRTQSEQTYMVHEDAGAPQSWSPDGRYLLYEPGATIAFIGRLEVPTKKTEVFLTHPEYSLRGAQYSPDGKWIAFHAELGREQRRIYIARGDVGTMPGEWIAVTDGVGFEVNPRWSLDGHLLYFIDETGGKRVIAAQRLNARTKRPEGKPFEVYDPKSARRSLLRLTRSRVGAIGPVITRDRIWISMDEQLGDVYYAPLP